MANGVFGGGSGISTNPYLIEDAVDLVAINKFPSAYFKLSRNINLGVHPFNTEKGWSPICNFTGSLDGNGKKILNLYINRPENDNVGLFLGITNTNTGQLKIKNLAIENANVCGHSNVGILAGNITNAQSSGVINPSFINNCKFTGNIKGFSNTGGVIGQSLFTGAARYLTNVFQDVYIDVNVTASNNNSSFGSVIGRWNSLSGNAGVTGKLVNVLSVSSFSNVIMNKEDISFQPFAFGYSPNALAMSRCYFDNDKWSSSSVTLNSIGCTTEELAKDTVAQYHTILDSEGNNIWDIQNDIEKSRSPELSLFNTKTIYIKAGESYYTYKNNAWDEVFNTYPTIEEAIASGMSKQQVKDISLTAWNDFVKDHASESISIVSFEEYSEGTNISDEFNIEMLPVESDINPNIKKNYFKKTFDFNDLGSSIVYIHKGDM